MAITINESSLKTPNDLLKFLRSTHGIEIRFLEFYSLENPQLIVVCYFTRWQLFWNSPEQLTRFIRFDLEDHLPEGIAFKIIATRL